jgi:hypothetical protein
MKFNVKKSKVMQKQRDTKLGKSTVKVLTHLLIHLFLEEGLTQRRQIPQSFAVQLMQLGLPQTRALLKNIINNLFTALVEAYVTESFLEWAIS